MRYLTLFCLLFFITVPSAISQSLEYISSDFWYGMNDIAVSGHYAYCAFESGVAVYDIANIDSIIPVNRTFIPGVTKDIFIDGNYVYTIGDYSSLSIFDISNPESLDHISSFEDWGDVPRLFVEGDRAFIANNASGPGGGIYILTTLDISDRLHPQILSRFDTTGGTDGFFVSGNYAYIANWSSLDIIDISDPYQPRFVAHALTYGQAHDVFVVGNYAYVADGGWGLTVLDVTVPEVPYPIGTCDMAGMAKQIIVRDTFAYVIADTFSGVLDGVGIFNISDPINPILVGTSIINQQLFSASLDSDYLFIPDNQSVLNIIDISDPVLPVLHSIYEPDQPTTAVALSGNYAFIGNRNVGIQILDINNPRYPFRAGQMNSGAYISEIQIDGTYAFVNNYNSLQVLDISAPMAPQEIGIYESIINGFYKSGNYLYVANWSDHRLEIVDISDFNQPNLIGMYTYDYWSGPFDVAVDSGFAYVTIGSGGLDILDISDPTTPVHIVRFDQQFSDFTTVVIRGETAVIGAGMSGIYWIDISDPINPTLIARNYDTFHPTDFAIDSNLIFITDQFFGVAIYDITDPTNQILIGEFSLPYYLRDIVIKDDYIYVAGEYAFVILHFNRTEIDHSQPLIPGQHSLLSNYPNPFNAQTTISFYLDNSSDAALEIYDISGRLIDNIFHDYLNMGSHSVTWDAGELSSGIYFIRLRTSQLASAKKCLLLK